MQIISKIYLNRLKIYFLLRLIFFLIEYHRKSNALKIALIKKFTNINRNIKMSNLNNIIDFEKLVKSSTNLSIKFKSKLVDALSEAFTDDEQKLFLANFYMYINFDSITDFPIDLEDAWKFVGFANKVNAKKTLENNFNENEDYKIINAVKYGEKLLVGKQKLTPLNKASGGSGLNKEQILLNIDTFKNLCVISKTPQGKSIRKYYIKLESIYNKLFNEERIQFDETIAEKDRIIKDQIVDHNLNLQKQTEIDLVIFFKNKKVCYIILFSRNGKWFIKYGNSFEIQVRLPCHKREIGNDCYLQFCIETYDEVALEKKFMQSDFVKERRTTILGIDGKNKVEILNLNQNKIQSEVQKFINILKKCNENVTDRDLELKRLDYEMKKFEYESEKEKTKQLEMKFEFANIEIETLRLNSIISKKVESVPTNVESVSTKSVPTNESTTELVSTNESIEESTTELVSTEESTTESVPTNESTTELVSINESIEESTTELVSINESIEESTIELVSIEESTNELILKPDFKNFLDKTIKSETGYIVGYIDIIENYLGIIPAKYKDILTHFNQDRENLKLQIEKYLKETYPTESHEYKRYYTSGLTKFRPDFKRPSSIRGFNNCLFSPIIRENPENESIYMKKASLLSIIDNVFEKIEYKKIHKKCEFIGIRLVVETVYNYIVKNDMDNYQHRNVNFVPLLTTNTIGKFSQYNGHPSIFVTDICNILVELGFQKCIKPHGFYLKINLF